MSILDTLKETVGLIQKVDNIDWYRQMIELNAQVYELFEENRSLKAELATRSRVTFKNNRYYAAEDESFCSRCWDAESLLMRLHQQGANGWCCPKCKTYVFDKRLENNDHAQTE